MPPGTSRYWPLDDLRLSVADLSLRPTRDEDLDLLADLLPLDMEMNPHTPRPFGGAEWLARGAALRQEHWRSLGSWTPDSWDLGLVVRRGDRLVGVQGLEGEHFGTLRTVETASWLGSEFRGLGLGKLMRSAVERGVPVV